MTTVPMDHADHVPPADNSVMGWSLRFVGSTARTLGLVSLTLYAFFFARVVVTHIPDLISIETAALQSIVAAVETGPGTGGSPTVTPSAGSGVASKTVDVPVISGIYWATVPAWLYLLVSLYAAYLFVTWALEILKNWLSHWKKTLACRWFDSICAFIGCLFQWIWSLIETLFLIFFFIGALFLVLINIAAIL
jgi:hypothetical protein